MRRTLCLVTVVTTAILGVFSSAAVADTTKDHVPQHVSASHADVSPSLRDIVRLYPNAQVKPGSPVTIEAEPARPVAHGQGPKTSARPDAAMQSAPVANVMVTPSLNFAGLGTTDNQAVLGTTFAPPDTNGAVGPAHYVQTINTLLKVWDKTGNPLLGPVRISYLWKGFGGPCEAQDAGDPIVLYDELADRWLISQFTGDEPNAQCIAISTSSDPTGTYYRYAFPMTASMGFVDYPHYGIWPDGYYMTAHQFHGNTWNGGGMFAFDRKKMLVGDPTAAFIYFTDMNIGGQLAADVDGNPPAPGTPEYVIQFDSLNYGSPADSLEVWQFHADFATPANSTFTMLQNLPVAAFNPDGAPNVPQNGTTQRLDSIADRLMHRLQYRNFGGYESLVLNHTVSTSATYPSTAASFQAAPRWYELRRTLPSGANFAINQQSTYAPDTTHRWMSSAAMDRSGDLAIGFSASSSTLTPSIRIAGRLAADPLNTLAQGETIVQTSAGSQTGGLARWGDYSALDVDPADGCTFWYTTEYLTGTGSFTNWATRVASFRFPTCTAVTRSYIQGTVTDTNGTPVVGAIVTTADGYSRTTDTNGQYRMTVANATYNMTASAAGYLPSSVSGVVVGSGATVVQNFVLTGTPVISLLSKAVNDAASNNNGVAEPGECVLLNTTLRNSGIVGATAISGTLTSSTTGVTITQGTSTFPDVAGNSTTTNATPFGFSVASSVLCGSTLNFTLTVNYAGGTTKVFTFSLPATTGAGTPVVFTNSTPVAIPDNNATGVSSTVSVTGLNTAAAKVSVAVYLTHTWVGDLVLQLVAPDGTTIDLMNRPGGSGNSGDNFGTSCSSQTVLDDAGATSIQAVTSAGAPYVGTFKPAVALSTMNGHLLNGIWTLKVSDRASIDTGTLQCWKLNLTPAACASVVIPTPAITGTSAVCPSGQISLSTSGGTSYQWSLNNNPISGATSATYTVPSASIADAGNYTVVAFNACGNGSTASAPFAVAVNSCTVSPVSIAVDDTVGSGSNANGVLEAGEQVNITTTWMNGGTSATTLTGTATNFSGPGGSGYYAITDGASMFGSIAAGNSAACSNCYQMGVFVPATRPQQHWDATFTETPSTTPFSTNSAKTWTVHIGNSFTDVTGGAFYTYIEALLHNGVTAGCSPASRLYCPTDTVLREQIAAFLARSLVLPSADSAIPLTGTANGNSYVCGQTTANGGISLFSDVAPENIFCKHIHYIYSQGISSGCVANSQFCPNGTNGVVTRRSLGVLVARSIVTPHDDAQIPTSYTDPVTTRHYDCSVPASLAFSDVTGSDPNCKQIYYIWAKGIVNGFPDGTYGPALNVTREQMAKFLTNAFSLKLNN